MQSLLTRRGRVGAEYGVGVVLAGAPFVQRSPTDAADRRRRRIGRAFLGVHAGIERAFLRPQGPFWRRVTEIVLGRLAKAGTTAVIVDELFSVAEFRDPFNRALKPAWSTAAFAGVQFEADWIGAREARQSLRGFGFRQDLGDEPGDIPPPPSFRVDLSREMEQRIRSFLKEREVGVWDKVGTTVHERLRRALQRGLKEGDTLDDLQGRIKGVLKSHSDYAARRIARTETTGGMNFGQQIERDDIGIELKEWVATIDGVTRGVDPTDLYNHLDADGQTTDNKGLFTVSGQSLAYPADGSHGASAGNIINCRCVGVAAFGEKSPKPVASAPVPIAQSVSEAERFARERNLADVIDYRQFSVEAANSMNRALDEALRVAPELRSQLRFVGSMQRRNAYFIKEYAKRKIEPLISRGYTADQITEQRKRMEAEASEILRKIGARLKEKTYAQSYPKNGAGGDIVSGIALNGKWAKDAQFWQERLEANVIDGFHPIGTASIRAVVDHEIAHQIDDLLGLARPGSPIDRELAQILAGKTRRMITEELSEYAAEDVKETIAEAWAEYKNSKQPRPLALQIGKLIESKLAALRKRP